MVRPWHGRGVAVAWPWRGRAWPWLGGQKAADLLGQLLMMPLEDLENGKDGMAAGKDAADVTELGKEVMTFMARPPPHPPSSLGLGLIMPWLDHA